MASIERSARHIVEAIEAHRFRSATEARLQAGLAELLGQYGFEYQRELVLTKADRIDFLVKCDDGGLGIEVKIQGSRAELVRQLLRYVDSEAIGAVLVVTSRVQLVHVPGVLGGKRIYMATILSGLI